MNEKIRISWDDVYSSAVDEKIRQQQAVQRADDHYRQPGLVASEEERGNLLYNALIYMTAFGLLGGLFSWPMGELVMWAFKTRIEEYSEYMYEVEETLTAHTDGEITGDEALEKIQSAAADYPDNELVEYEVFKFEKELLLQEFMAGRLADDQFVNEVELLRARYPENPLVQADAQDLTDEEQEDLMAGMLLGDIFKGWLGTVAFCALCGLTISFFLSIADPVMSRNWRSVVINGSVGLCLGLVGGGFVGLFIDFLYSALQPESEEALEQTLPIGQVIARTVGWSIVGFFLAIAPGVVLKNWKRLLIGLAGGFLGGLIGGVLFDMVAIATDSGLLSRMIGLTAIGMIAGLGTGIIENAAKSGWLKVTAGLIVGKQFILYRNPTYIGSSPGCEIYLFKDNTVSPQHACLHIERGGYELQDMQSETGTYVNGRAISRTRLKNGDQIQIGGTLFSFQEKERGQQQQPAMHTPPSYQRY